MKHFTLILLSALAFCCQAMAQQRAGLSPFTRQYLHAADAVGKIADPLPGYVYKQAQDGSLLLSAFLKVVSTFSEETLTPLGVRIGTKAGRVWTAQIPPASLRAVTELPGLRYIQLDEPIAPQMDSARRKTRVDSVHAGINLPQAFTGQNVVIGIIDDGFDYGHPTLFDTTGTGYRVRKVWEQRITGTPPTGYAYGREMTDSAAMWAAGTDWPTGSHGAHVAGIAAGSGAGGPGAGASFRGMAYRSDVVLVAIMPEAGQWTSTGVTDVVDGMAYIFNYAASVGKPAVVNLSWGSIYGPHDGTSLFSEACDALTGPGKIFCVAAMNNGQTNIHLAKTFTTTDTVVRSVVTLPTNFPAGLTTEIDVWGDTAQALCTRLTLYDGPTPVDSTVLFCADNSMHSVFIVGSDGDTCFVTATTEGPSFNDKPRVYLTLLNKSANTVCFSMKSIGGKADAWMGSAKDGILYFGAFTNNLPGAVSGDAVSTVSDFASTHSAISVGHLYPRGQSPTSAARRSSLPAWLTRSLLSPRAAPRPTGVCAPTLPRRAGGWHRPSLPTMRRTCPAASITQARCMHTRILPTAAPIPMPCSPVPPWPARRWQAL